MSIEQAVRTYLQDVESKNETSRKERFIRLLSDLFPNKKREIDLFTLDAETYVKYEKPPEDQTQRGFIDTFYGNLVIEFEHGLPEMQEEAERQLRGYVAKLWSDTENKRPFLAIATDGVKWNLYTPLLEDGVAETSITPDLIKLVASESYEAKATNTKGFYNFLDRVLFRDNQLTPTSHNINSEFKSGSYLHSVITDNLTGLYERSSDIKIVNESFMFWREYLKYSYGNIEGSKELYISHTYMSGFSKILVAFILSDRMNKTLSESNLPSILEGSFFYDLGVRNYIEQDFFYWINLEGIKKLRLDVWRIVFNVLKTYDFKEINSDFLKDIYQNLIDPNDRHDLGEYYTPDWLCEKIVSDSLKDFSKKKKHIIADVSCGSGSFLRASINNFKKQNNNLNAQNIADAVVGFDIHPLAVFIAKTNYLIALGELVNNLDQPLNIPVYLCDSLSGPEDDENMVSKLYFKVNFLDEEYLFPKVSGFDGTEFDLFINCIHTIVSKQIDETNDFLGKYLKSRDNLKFEKKEYNNFMKVSLKLIMTLNKNYTGVKSQLWACILKNLHRPVFFKNKVSHIVGNPPWLTFKDVDNPNYRKELEHLGLKKYRVAPSASRLRTQMELATIFLCHCIDYFMKKEALIYFVIPRSIYNTDQHSELRGNQFNVDMAIKEIWDLEGVSPLFRTLSCVLIAQKSKKQDTIKNIKGVQINGKLPEQNCNLSVAKNYLEQKNVTYNVIKMNNRTAIHHENFLDLGKDCYYIDKFKQGATIVPRNFTFVDVNEGDLNKKILTLKTPEDINKNAKAPYKGHTIEGRGSSKFIFKTLLADSILPFVVVKDYRVHLPVILTNNSWAECPIEEVYSISKDSGEYFDKAIEKYNELASSEMSYFERLNYNNELLSQNPEAKYWVLYCASGKNLCASIYTNEDKLWIDHTNYWFCGTKQECHYLVGVLNSPAVNKLIKPFQSKGLLGERHVHKKVLDIGIPRFNTKNNLHLKIASSSNKTSKKAQNLTGDISYKKIGAKRNQMKEFLANELNQIDELVLKLFKDQHSEVQ